MRVTPETQKPASDEQTRARDAKNPSMGDLGTNQDTYAYVVQQAQSLESDAAHRLRHNTRKDFQTQTTAF